MNASTHRLVVLIVGALALLALAGIIACAVLEKDAPKVLELATTSALTGLLGLVASPRPETVRIDQPAGDPVPVTPVDGGFTVIQWLVIVALVLAILFLGTQLFDVDFRG